MSLDLRVPGDPDACETASRGLRALGDAVASAAGALGRQAHTSDDDFGGLSGDAFRDRTRSLMSSADDTADHCHRLAAALQELALDLRDVRRTMAVARHRARPWLVVTEDAIHPPGPEPGAGATPWSGAAWQAWDDAARLVGDARQVEHRAQRDWRAALALFADVVPPTIDLPTALLPGAAVPPAPPVYDPALGSHLPPLTQLLPDAPTPHTVADTGSGQTREALPSTTGSGATAGPQPAAQSAGAGHLAAAPAAPGEWGFGHVPSPAAAPESPPTCGTSPVASPVGEVSRAPR